MLKFHSAILITLGINVSTSFASEGLSMGTLLKSANPLPLLKEEVTRDANNATSLCQQILDPSFYEISKGEDVAFGVIKRNELIAYCSGTEFEKAKLKPATQKPQEEEVPYEMPKLKPVNFKRGNNVSEETKFLEEATAIVIENAKALDKEKEITERLIQVQDNLKEAQEYYDNLKMVIMVMREDLQVIPGFKYFNPHDHDDSTPEEYLEALNNALAQESSGILDPASLEQLHSATQLLAQANENLAAARSDLEKINREMLALTY